MNRTQRLSSPAFAAWGSAVLSIVFGLQAVSQSQAAVTTIVDSQGFELPNFDANFSGVGIPVTGQLEGQAPFPTPLPVGTWLRTKGTGTSQAVVQTAVVGSGSQAVKVDRAAASNGDQRWAVPVSGWPSERYICIDWSMRVEQTVSMAFGPFFGVEAYDDDAATIGLLASFGVDASTGEILYQQVDTGVLVAPGPTVAFGAWNDYSILLDYSLHIFELRLNGALIATEGFVDHNNIPGGLNEFTDADISTLAAAGDPISQSLAGTAYYDNFKVIQSDTNPCIPEPATWALASVALVAVWRRRNAG